MGKKDKECVQAYSGQAAVDEKAQVIEAQSLSNCAAINRQAQDLSADAG